MRETLLALLLLGGINIILIIGFIYERSLAFKREQALINRVMAKSLPELADNLRKLNMTPEDEKDIMKLENELATKASEIEKELAERRKYAGIPIM